MNDFLGRLAERALGFAPLIRPLIPSIYTPTAREADLVPTVLPEAGIPQVVSAAAQGVTSESRVKEEFAEQAVGGASPVRTAHPTTIEELVEIPGAQAEVLSGAPLAPSSAPPLSHPRLGGPRPATRVPQRSPPAVRVPDESAVPMPLAHPSRTPVIPVVRVIDGPREVPSPSAAPGTAQTSARAPGLAARSATRAVGRDPVSAGPIHQSEPADGPLSRGVTTGQEASDGQRLQWSAETGPGPASHSLRLSTGQTATQRDAPGRGRKERDVARRTAAAGLPTIPGTGDEPFARPADGAGTRESTTAAPPAVRVTIGTIEVRAVTQAAAPVPERPPSGPKLSLDEYLERRHQRRGT